MEPKERFSFCLCAERDFLLGAVCSQMCWFSSCQPSSSVVTILFIHLITILRIHPTHSAQYNSFRLYDKLGLSLASTALNAFRNVQEGMKWIFFLNILPDR